MNSFLSTFRLHHHYTTLKCKLDTKTWDKWMNSALKEEGIVFAELIFTIKLSAKCPQGVGLGISLRIWWDSSLPISPACLDGLVYRLLLPFMQYSCRRRCWKPCWASICHWEPSAQLTFCSLCLTAFPISVLGKKDKLPDIHHPTESSCIS